MRIAVSCCKRIRSQEPNVSDIRLWIRQRVKIRHIYVYMLGFLHIRNVQRHYPNGIVGVFRRIHRIARGVRIVMLMVEPGVLRPVSKRHRRQAEPRRNISDKLLHEPAIRKAIAICSAVTRTEQSETVVRGNARGLAELRNRIRQLLIYLLFVAHVVYAVLKSRLQYIPDDSVWHVAGVCEHQSRSIAVKTCIVSVYVKTCHYLQLKSLFNGNIETDVLRG